MDVQMAGMDGFTLAATIKADSAVDHARLFGTHPPFRRIEATGDRGH